MASIPTAPDKLDNREGFDSETGIPQGFYKALNDSFVVNMNMDGEVLSNREQSNNTLLYGIPRIALGAFTELAAALPGVSDEEAVGMAESFTPDKLYNDFIAHKEGSQTLGAIGLSLIPIVGMNKLMRAPKVFNTVKKLFGSRVASVVLPSQISMMDRVAKFKEKAAILASKQQIAFTKQTTPALENMRKSMIYSEALDTLKIGLATDLGIYAVANESNFMFPDELTAMETAAFYGLPNAVVSVATGAMMRYSLKNALRDVGGIADKARNKMDVPLSDIIAVPGSRHAFITTLAAQRSNKAAEFAEVTGDAILSQNINAQIKELDVVLTQQIESLAKDSLINGVTKQWDLDIESLNTVNAAMKEDWAAVREVISLENYTARSAKTLLEDIEKRKLTIDNDLNKTFVSLGTLDKKSKEYKTALDKFAKLTDEKDALTKLTAVKINTDGSMQLAANSKQTYDDLITGRMLKNSSQANINKTLSRGNEGDLIKTIDDATQTEFYSFKVKEAGSAKTVTVSNNMKTLLPEGLDYGKLSFKGKTAVQTAVRAAVADFKIGDDLLQTFKPTAEMHHVELDGMLEVADRFSREDDKLIEAFKFTDNGVDGIKDFDALEFASIKSKYQDFIKQMDVMGQQKISKIQQPEIDKLKIEDIIRTLNLPNDGTTGMHPIAQLFMDAYVNRVGRFEDKFPDINTVKQTLIKDAKPQSDLDKFMVKRDIQLRGSAYKTYDEPRKPVYMLLKSQYENPLHREDLISQVMGERLAFVDKLKDAENAGAPMITAMTQAAMRDKPRWDAAVDVNSLVEGSARGTDRFAQITFAAENQPAIMAVDAITGETDNIWRSYAAKQFEPFNKSLNNIISHENKKDLLSFNIFTNQQGLGWRGKSALVPVEKEGNIIGYKIALEDHDINTRLYKEAYGSDIPASTFMPSPLLKQGATYEPLVISPAAAEVVNAFNSLSQDVLKHGNHLRSMVGLRPIPAKDLHMIAKNLSGKELLYLIDKNTGKVAAVKAGNTPVQVKSLADEEIAIGKKQGKDLFIATDIEMDNYQLAKFEALYSMEDFSSSLRQTGTAKGTSFGQTIEIGPEVVTRMQEAYVNQYASLAKITSSMIFRPELQAAASAIRTSGLKSVKVDGKKVIGKDRTVQQMWMNRALGNKSGSKVQSIGKAYGAVEDIYDDILQKIWDTKIQAFKGGQTQGQAADNFAALGKAVPDYNPFKDSVEFLENTMKIKTPHNMIKHMSTLGSVTGLTMLRMFNVGLSLINVGTLPTLIPAVTKAIARMPDESIQAFKQRNQAWSAVIDDNTVIWDPTKTFTNGMQFMFSDEWKKIAPLAAKKGHLWQETVERLQLFSAPAMTNTEKSIKKWVELSAKITDASEELSRGIAYATFYNMGRKNLKLDVESAMDFAHHKANLTIGDFRPNVRPQMFQGATGMPFSLFTTFAWNYMQRVFGYVEKGQFKTLMNQMGLQSVFFGAKSLPGFSLYVDNFTDNYDGSENLVDRLNQSFPSEFVDYLMNGSVGGLTGLAVHTKASMPFPGSNFFEGRTTGILDMAAATSMVKQTYGFVADSLKSINTNEGLNSQQLSEIASRSFPVINMRGWFDLAQGVQVDSRGQVLNNNVYNALDVFSRVSRIKTIRNQQVVEEFARQRSTQLRQNDIRQQSRMALRSAFRGGKLDGDFIVKMAKDYSRAGGEPKGLKPFLQRQLLEGLVDKSYLRALELAKKQSKESEYLRMMDIISDD